MRKSLLSLAIALSTASSLSAFSGCAATGDPDGGDPDVSRDNPIVNGQETSDYPATGMLLVQGQPYCTGTVVAPRTVITAAHCVDQVDASQMTFGFGPSQYQIEAEVQVA